MRTQDVTSTSVNVSWEPPKYPNGKLLRYEVVHARTGVILDVLNANTWKLTDLNPGTTYTIYVRAITAAGVGNYSAAVTITTRLDCKSVMCLGFIMIIRYDDCITNE